MYSNEIRHICRTQNLLSGEIAFCGVTSRIRMLLGLEFEGLWRLDFLEYFRKKGGNRKVETPPDGRNRNILNSVAHVPLADARRRPKWPSLKKRCRKTGRPISMKFVP